MRYFFFLPLFYFGVCFENKKPELAVASCSLSILIVIFTGKHVDQEENFCLFFILSTLAHVSFKGEKKRNTVV